MNILDRRALKTEAEDALSFAPNHRKLVLIWVAVSTALPLFVSILNFILNSQIAETGGLSGIGLRSVLSTVQSALSSLTYMLAPFWTLGYTAVILRFARRKPANGTTLLEGFRRFGPVLRLTLLKVLLFCIVGITSFYAGIIILSLTPLAKPVYAVFTQYQDILLSNTADEVVLAAAAQAMMPMFLICCALCMVVLTPIMYRLRLADYCVLDSSTQSGLAAILESRRLMHRNCLTLFRLDLSFWWYYLAQLLLSLLCYGDVILPAMGITMPFSDDAAFFIFYIAALLAQMALLYFFSNRVQTTYALFYNTLRTPPEEENMIVI